MNFAIVWLEESGSSPLGVSLGATARIALPHLVDDRGESSLQATVSAKTLSLGILMVTDQEQLLSPANPPTRAQYQAALRITAADLGAPDEDELCASAARHLRERYGIYASLAALRRAVKLVPDSVMARGDLIVTLFFIAHQTDADVTSLMQEIATEFRLWHTQATNRCTNEEMVFYAGLAAVTYLGLAPERDQILAIVGSRFAISSWLILHVQHFQQAQPHQLAGIPKPPARSHHPDRGTMPTPSRREPPPIEVEASTVGLPNADHVAELRNEGELLATIFAVRDEYVRIHDHVFARPWTWFLRVLRLAETPNYAEMVQTLAYLLSQLEPAAAQFAAAGPPSTHRPAVIQSYSAALLVAMRALLVLIRQAAEGGGANAASADAIRVYRAAAQHFRVVGEQLRQRNSVQQVVPYRSTP